MSDSGFQPPEDKIFSNLLNWSTHLTAENTPESTPYLKPDSMSLLAQRLKAVKGALVGVVGLRGVGKSSAALHLSMELEDCVALKLNEDLKERQEFILQRKEALCEKIIELSRSSPIFRRRMKKIFGGADFQDLNDDNDPIHEKRDARKDASLLLDGKEIESSELEDSAHYFEGLFLKGEIKDIEREALDRMLIRARTILITMPDYPSRDPRAIAKDINEIQRLWGKARQLGENPNIVLFLQAETFSTQDHFFFGKLLIYKIEPFRAEQLFQYYLDNFGSTWPFEEETLRYLSKISRGIFRRFKRFIGILLEAWQIADRSKLIDGEFVDRHLPIDVMEREMDLELSQAFRNAKQKELAMRIISLTMQGRTMSQRGLAKHLEISESALSVLLGRLEAYGWVKRDKVSLPDGGYEHLVRSAVIENSPIEKK